MLSDSFLPYSFYFPFDCLIFPFIALLSIQKLIQILCLARTFGHMCCTARIWNPEHCMLRIGVPGHQIIWFCLCVRSWTIWGCVSLHVIVWHKESLICHPFTVYISPMNNAGSIHEISWNIFEVLVISYLLSFSNPYISLARPVILFCLQMNIWCLRQVRWLIEDKVQTGTFWVITQYCSH